MAGWQGRVQREADIRGGGGDRALLQSSSRRGETALLRLQQEVRPVVLCRAGPRPGRGARPGAGQELQKQTWKRFKYGFGI